MAPMYMPRKSLSLPYIKRNSEGASMVSQIIRYL